MKKYSEMEIISKNTLDYLDKKNPNTSVSAIAIKN